MHDIETKSRALSAVLATAAALCIGSLCAPPAHAQSSEGGGATAAARRVAASGATRRGESGFYDKMAAFS